MLMNPTYLFVDRIFRNVTAFLELCFACALFLVTGCAHNSDQNYTNYTVPGLSISGDEAYLAEKQKLIDRDPDVNFNTLRWSYRSSSFYVPWDTQEHEAGLAMFNAFEDGDYTLCLNFANAMLDRNYVSIGAHFGAYSCHAASGSKNIAAFHRYVISGLVDSIEQSGDGLSAETAYVTISPSEMRSYMQVRGLVSYRQELVDVPSKYIEKFFVISRESEAHLELYFDNSASLINHIQPKPPAIP